MERWRGRTAVVTGAGSGIGAAIADKLAKEGLQVVGVDINVTAPGKGTLLKCDVTNLSELKDTFRKIDETYGGVDVMVNCAGTAKRGHITSVGSKQLSDADIARIMDLNIKAMIFCCRYAVDSMKKRGIAGHIVNINSIAGHYVAFHEEFNVYSSSKYAVTAFTQSLFHEISALKSNIKVTSISPGLVWTPMTMVTMKDFPKVPALQPSDIADAVAYAISTPPHVNISELTVQPTGEIRQ